jgi:hypothetical protein
LRLSSFCASKQQGLAKKRKRSLQAVWQQMACKRTALTSLWVGAVFLCSFGVKNKNIVDAVSLRGL